MAKVNKIYELVREKNFPIYELAIAGEGIPVSSQKYMKGNRGQDVYSVAKVFVVTAVGMLYDQGLLKTTDTVMKYLSKYAPEGMDHRWNLITIDDALKHRIGMPHGYLDIDVGTIPSDDYLNYLLTTPFAAPPCQSEEYTDAAYYLLARLCEEIIGDTLDNYLMDKLFTPLKFAEVAWTHCPQGHVIGATGLYLSAADVAKLGEVYRNGGTYNGKRIISEEWAWLVLNQGYELNPLGFTPGYGKSGMYGQQIAVLTDLNITVAWTGYEFYQGEEIIRIIKENL